MTLRPLFRHSATEESIHDGHYIYFGLYCKKTWLKALKVKTGPIRDLCTGAHGKLVTPLT